MLLPIPPQSGSRWATSWPSEPQQLRGLGDGSLDVAGDDRRRRSAGGEVDRATRSEPGGVLADSTNGRSGGGGASGSREPPAVDVEPERRVERRSG